MRGSPVDLVSFGFGIGADSFIECYAVFEDGRRFTGAGNARIDAFKSVMEQVALSGIDGLRIFPQIESLIDAAADGVYENTFAALLTSQSGAGSNEPSDEPLLVPGEVPRAGYV